MSIHEIDCPDCGTHHVVDEDDITAFLKQRKFRCSECRKRVPIRYLSGIVLGDPEGLTGICYACDRS